MLYRFETLELDEACRERALPDWTESRLALSKGRHEDTVRRGDRARSLGVRLPDPDMEALGLVYSGHGMVAIGEIERGLAPCRRLRNRLREPTS